MVKSITISLVNLYLWIFALFLILLTSFIEIITNTFDGSLIIWLFLWCIVFPVILFRHNQTKVTN
ncbi:MAG: hypothetical protein ACXAC2_08725 [Candidatus Kariarchaeaceae archaeon]